MSILYTRYNFLFKAPAVPCEQSLFLLSWVKKRKVDSVWIVSSPWGHCSPNFQTRQVVFYCKTVFSIASIPFTHKVMVKTEPTVAGTQLLGLQCAKKVVSNSPRLVDFTIRLVYSIFNLPYGQMKHYYFWASTCFKLQLAIHTSCN